MSHLEKSLEILAKDYNVKIVVNDVLDNSEIYHVEAVGNEPLCSWFNNLLKVKHSDHIPKKELTNYVFSFIQQLGRFKKAVEENYFVKNFYPSSSLHIVNAFSYSPLFNDVGFIKNLDALKKFTNEYVCKKMEIELAAKGITISQNEVISTEISLGNLKTFSRLPFVAHVNSQNYILDDKAELNVVIQDIYRDLNLSSKFLDGIQNTVGSTDEPSILYVDVSDMPDIEVPEYIRKLATSTSEKGVSKTPRGLIFGMTPIDGSPFIK